MCLTMFTIEAIFRNYGIKLMRGVAIYKFIGPDY